ncbi:MAG: hydrogenase/urease maturation nickel metallochaperone HypA [Planctomycetota bacterium]|jgi:Zn finger protein HypA/HybF involved in hydrogenase expression
MHEHGLAKELLGQIEQIAASSRFVRVTRIEMVVGALHGATAEFLAHSFEHAFEGSALEGSGVAITVIDPGQKFTPPGAAAPVAATGWELLITRIEGEK